MKQLVISIDFDLTVCGYAPWPQIGKLNQQAKDVIVELYNSGHIILFNSLREGDHKKKAIDWLNYHQIPFHKFNENHPPRIQKYYDSRKIGADLYIDDRSLDGVVWAHVIPTVEYLQKPTIICIVGESGSGKTAIAEYCESQYGIKMIESRTTRPKRSPNESGHTFVSDKEFDAYNQDEMIAFTKFGDYRYCCLKKDVLDVNTYVIDEYGLKYLQEHYSDQYNIISVRKYRNKADRIKDVGEERVRRDKGKFTMMSDEFDFLILCDGDMSEVYNRADYVMSRIFTSRRDQWGNNLALR